MLAAQEPPGINPPLITDIFPYTFNTAGTFEVSLTVVDDLGDSDTYSLTVAIQDLPEAIIDPIEINQTIIDDKIERIEDKTYGSPIALAGVDKTVYVGETVSFECKGILGSEVGINPPPSNDIMLADESTETESLARHLILYEWDFNGDNVVDWSSSSVSTIDYVYNTAGTYTASLTVTDNEYQTGIDETVITVVAQTPSTGSGGSGGIYSDNTTEWPRDTPDGLVQTVTSEDDTVAEIETEDQSAGLTDEVSQLEGTPLMTMFFVTIVILAGGIFYVMYKGGKFPKLKKLK